MTKLTFLDSDVSRASSYYVYISQINRFARASSPVNKFTNRNKKSQPPNFLGKGTIIINYLKYFLNFIAIILNDQSMSKYKVGFKKAKRSA